MQQGSCIPDYRFDFLGNSDDVGVASSKTPNQLTCYHSVLSLFYHKP